MEDKPKVSVIIPTYNRFEFLKNAVSSVKNQINYPKDKIEIIIINDGSTQKEYYDEELTHELYANCIVINQIENSKVKFGYGCVGYNRNEAVKRATGEYLAFLDDDDYWLPHKLDLQMSEMLKQNFEFSCTDGLYGRGTYNSEKNYPKYNREYHWKFLSNKLGFKDDFPDVWDLNLINRWNLIINSSVVMKKSLYERAGGMPYKRRGQDYECWKNCLQYTDVLYIKTPCMYYDDLHGNGQNH